MKEKKLEIFPMAKKSVSSNSRDVGYSVTQGPKTLHWPIFGMRSEEEKTLVAASH